jgi:hypothetical protein
LHLTGFDVIDIIETAVAEFLPGAEFGEAAVAIILLHFFIQRESPQRL